MYHPYHPHHTGVAERAERAARLDISLEVRRLLLSEKHQELSGFLGQLPAKANVDETLSLQGIPYSTKCGWAGVGNTLQEKVWMLQHFIEDLAKEGVVPCDHHVGHWYNAHFTVTTDYIDIEGDVVSSGPHPPIVSWARDWMPEVIVGAEPHVP